MGMGDQTMMAWQCRDSNGEWQIFQDSKTQIREPKAGTTGSLEEG